MISAIVLAGGDFDKDLYRKCLSSLSWLDDLIILKRNTVKSGFASARNDGAKEAKGDWLLYVDTDEEITPSLKKVILDVTKSDKFSAYAIPRRNFIFGKEFRHGGAWPDYVLHLIKKDKLKGWYGDLHEQPKVEGKIAHLKEPLIHHKHKSISEMVDKTNDWSEIEARLMFEAHHPKMNIIRFFTAGFREFWHRMIGQLAFLDGKEGIIYALYQVYSRLISYSKLWEMQLRDNKKI